MLDERITLGSCYDLMPRVLSQLINKQFCSRTLTLFIIEKHDQRINCLQHDQARNNSEYKMSILILKDEGF